MSDFSFIMAVDPGITTGLAYGTVDHMKGATIEDLIAVNVEGVTVEQIWERDEIAAAIQIATLFMSKRDDYKDMTKPRCAGIHLVIEDFLLRPGVVSTKREVLAPVRIMAAIEAILVLNNIPNLGQTVYTRRLPSMAMQYATSKRLREWGAWDVAKGKPHGRDAVRHWCTQVAKLQGVLSMPDQAQPQRRVRPKDPIARLKPTRHGLQRGSLGS